MSAEMARMGSMNGTALNAETMKELGVEVGREVGLAIAGRPSTPDALACGEEVAERAIARGLKLRGWSAVFRLKFSVQAGPMKALVGRPVMIFGEWSADFDEGIAQAFIDGVADGWKEMAPSPFAGLFGAW